ncbi:hypothetical protein P8C59_008384 [Phyllachora maydis]|uniref:Conserved oligomeric Golgi complex subunit 2 n=1 Tax=Phyllachora maydis TaxID=1825666 RepID=A0AAD9IAM3_9PEZI|nr:hypothetical protein P8C59_008384 [Phyllachora maydis]
MSKAEAGVRCVILCTFKLFDRPFPRKRKRPVPPGKTMSRPPLATSQPLLSRPASSSADNNDPAATPANDLPTRSSGSFLSPLPPDLPFPTALARADFLAPDFDPAAYLSVLHTGGPTARHQTLEDLRAELRERSAAVSAELLELVNAHYTSFLGLGDELQGGGERVQDLRVALLGFRRAVEEVKARVAERRAEVGRLVDEVEAVAGAVERGRRMLELEERLSELEIGLAVAGVGRVRVGEEEGKGEEVEEDVWAEVEDSDEEEDEDEDEEVNGLGRGGEADGAGFVGSSPAKLLSLHRQYRVIEDLVDALGRDLPFVAKMEERIRKCRTTILLDLGTATKEARAAGPKRVTRVMKYLEVYRMLDAGAEAVQALKK